MEENKTLHKIKIFLLSLLLLLTALSYHPLFSSFVTEDLSENPLNKYVLLLTGITFVAHIGFKSWYRDTYIRTFFVLYFCVILMAVFLQQHFSISGYMDDIKNIMIAFVLLLIGYNAHLTKNETMLVAVLYTLMVLFSIYFQIIANFGGFVIEDEYMQYGKNTLGVMTAASCITISSFALTAKRKLDLAILWFLVFALVVVTLTIRARTASITIGVFFIYCVYRKIKESNKITETIFAIAVIGLITVLFLLITSNVIDVVWGYVYDSFTQHHEDDLTSYRMDRIEIAWEFWKDDIWFGNLASRYNYRVVHNYPLRVLFSYGVFGSLPLLSLYLYISVYSIKQCIKNKFDFGHIGHFAFLTTLMISMAEPTFPYAPGTGVILVFVLLGNNLFYNRKQSVEKK